MRQAKITKNVDLQFKLSQIIAMMRIEITNLLFFIMVQLFGSSYIRLKMIEFNCKMI